MRDLLAVLLLACAARAEAAPHTLVVRMSQGMRTYTHTEKLEEGAQGNFVGKPDGGFGRNMIVNAMIAREGAAYSVQLQLELSAADKSRTFEVQNAVEMRAGERLTQTECGDWKVELILDGKSGRAAPASGAWTSGGLDNDRLTADVSAGGKTRRCRQVSKLGAQSNIVDSVTTNGRRGGFILNAVVSQGAGGFGLQYQLEQGPFKAQGQDILALGRALAVAPAGGKISFLVEGAPPAAPKAPPATAAPASSGNNEGSVPLLR